jgi:hypothetical protein
MTLWSVCSDLDGVIAKVKTYQLCQEHLAPLQHPCSSAGRSRLCLLLLL